MLSLVLIFEYLIGRTAVIKIGATYVRGGKQVPEGMALQPSVRSRKAAGDVELSAGNRGDQRDDGKQLPA